MTNTIKLRRILNQGQMDKRFCHEMNCHSFPRSCVGSYSGLEEMNWWVKQEKGLIPCFIYSHWRRPNLTPIHPQDPEQPIPPDSIKYEEN